MQVFKLCGKVMRQNRLPILIYITVFIMLSLIMTAAASKDQTYQYTAEKTEIAFLTEENTPLVEGMKAALSENAAFMDIEDTPAVLADALYYREVSYIIRVPAGFTDAFMKGEDPQLGCTSVPGSFSGTYISEKLQLWLQTASMYVKTGAVTDADTLADRMNDVMSKTASVAITDSGTKSVSDYSFLSYYFKYLAYILTAILISILAVLMQVFNDRDLRRRTFCSPITAYSYNGQFLLAGMAFSAGLWIVMMVCGAAFTGKTFFQESTLLYALNSLAYTMMAAALGFLIGTLTTSREQVGALANVCSLGFSFLGGIFIPQAYMGKGVLAAAHFTPAYWYVKANDALAAAKNLSSADITAVRNSILVLLCFGAAFLAIGLAAEKRRREFSEA